MKDESPLTLFSRRLSRDIGSARARARYWIQYARWWGLARLRAILWHAAALGAVILLSGIILAVWKVPQWQAATWEDRWKGKIEPKDVAKLENDARTTLVQTLGGVVLIIGLFFTWRNLRITERNSRETFELSHRGQLHDRLTKAIELLNAVTQEGEKHPGNRLLGIYVLEQIAKESPNYSWPIMQILSNYLRENTPWPPKTDKLLTEKDQPFPKPAADIQAILTILENTWAFEKIEYRPLDLRKTDLRGANLHSAYLKGADLTDAHLERADLSLAHLMQAHLTGAHLEEARLVGVNLKEAILEGADLKGALFVGTILEGATLTDAHLENANLMGAHLKGAKFSTVEQLAQVKTLYKADLDPRLLEQIQQRYPHLLEQPSS